MTEEDLKCDCKTEIELTLHIDEDDDIFVEYWDPDYLANLFPKTLKKLRDDFGESSISATKIIESDSTKLRLFFKKGVHLVLELYPHWISVQVEHGKTKIPYNYLRTFEVDDFICNYISKCDEYLTPEEIAIRDVIV